MTINWQSASEINFGLIIDGKISPAKFTADDFFPPYDEGIELLVKKPDSAKEDLAQAVGLQAFQSAHQAAASLNGLGESTDWPELLREQANKYRAGLKFEKAASRLKRGEDVDVLQLSGDLHSITDEKTGGLRRADQIDYNKFEEFIPSGWPAIDKHFGGIPHAGLLLVVGETSVGKSFFLAKLTNDFLHQHPDKIAGIFTLEMSEEEYLKRSIAMYPTLEEVKGRLYISGKFNRIEEIGAETAAKELDFAGVDFIDYLVAEGSETEYAKVYKECVRISRMLGIPFCMLAQPQREGYKNKLFPRKWNIRWSGMAENSAWQLLMLFKGNELDVEDDRFPLFDEDHYYIICEKQRGGWPTWAGKERPSALAVILEPGKTLWEGNVRSNRAWMPGSGVKAIGQQGGKKRRSNP